MFRNASTALLLLVAVGCGGAGSESAEDPDWSSVVQSANDVLFNQGQVDRVSEFFAASYGGGGGSERIREFVSDLRTAFPDLQVEVEILVSKDDRVTWVRRHRGTHQGEYRGVPATGREMTWRSMVVSRFEGGLIAQEWSVSELAGVLQASQ